MERVQLAVQVRMQLGKNIGKKLLREGKVPAVVYGSGGESLPLELNLKQLQKGLSTPAGANAIFDLIFKNDSLQDRVTAMISDLQFEPLSRELIHADFKQIELDEPIETEIPIHLSGEAKGAALGGIIQQQIRTLKVECLPNNLPQQINVDLTGLDLGDSFKVGQLAADSNFNILADPEEIIVTIVPPSPAEEETAPSPDKEKEKDEEDKEQE